MHLSRLNDAALALHQVLAAAGIKYGIFGGYAIAARGGPRESKDIDCVASVTKQGVIDVLNGRNGFVYIDQSRQDYVAFLWSDKPNRERAVLVEIFVSSFPGAVFGMENVATSLISVAGQVNGTGSTEQLDPVFIFKGKLRAAATRGKFHDSADLRWLEDHYSNLLRQNCSVFNLDYAGLALKRYPELEYAFVRIGIDVKAAKARAAHVDITKLPQPQPGDVQKGILGN